MISNQIARFYLYPRDAVAHALIRLGVRPNHMSILGLLLTIGAGAGLAGVATPGSRWGAEDLPFNCYNNWPTG